MTDDRHAYRRQAETHLAAVTRQLEKTKDPRKVHALHTMADRITSTLDRLDRADERHSPYSGGDIGFKSRRHDGTHSRVLPHLEARAAYDAIHDAMRMITDYIPPYAPYGDFDEYARQGVPGTGPHGDRRHLGRGGRRRTYRTRYAMDTHDHDMADYDDHDMEGYADFDEAEMARRGTRRRRDRYGRFAPSRGAEYTGEHPSMVTRHEHDMAIDNAYARGHDEARRRHHLTMTMKHEEPHHDEVPHSRRRHDSADTPTHIGPK